MGGSSWSVVGVLKPENASDQYAVAVKKGTTIGHLPQKVSRVCSLFLRWGGSYYKRTVTGQGNIQLTWHKADLKFPALLIARQRLWNP